jgi:hypothetical protein
MSPSFWQYLRYLRVCGPLVMFDVAPRVSIVMSDVAAHQQRDRGKAALMPVQQRRTGMKPRDCSRRWVGRGRSRRGGARGRVEGSQADGHIMAVQIQLTGNVGVLNQGRSGIQHFINCQISGRTAGSCGGNENARAIGIRGGENQHSRAGRGLQRSALAWPGAFACRPAGDLLPLPLQRECRPIIRPRPAVFFPDG